MTAPIALLLLSIAGLLLLVVVLAVADGRQDRSVPYRRPIPYPGCCACLVADADDVAGVRGRLEVHQILGHTGGPRW